MSLTAEQVLEKTQQNGTFDKMRKEVFDSFVASERGKAFEKTINGLLQTISEDPEMRWSKDKAKFLEKQLLEHFGRNRDMERIERDARNFWLVPERRDRLKTCISQAIDELRDSSALNEHKKQHRQVATRSLELDPPRLPPRGTRGAGRSHNFYRRGDSVAAFLSTTDVLSHTPPYICLLVDITACDAPRGMYTVEDLDKTGADLQHTWVVYWDQILAIKRPYEQVYRPGDQVYALFRDDYGTDAAVSTEFFPGRIEQVSQMVLAIRFDTGEICHVYYDEVFAAGRVGFMRQMSEERRKQNTADAMVEVNGRFLPSFTGFWPETAQPALGKHGHKVRYRQPPHILVEHRPRAAVQTWEQNTTRAITPTAREARGIGYHDAVEAQSSDMELDSSGGSPPSPSRSAIDRKPADLQPAATPKVLSESIEPALATRPSSSSIHERAPSRKASHADLQRPADGASAHNQGAAERKPNTDHAPESPSSEDGEIGAGEEEGELQDSSYPPVTPKESARARDMSPSIRRSSLTRSTARHGGRESRWDRRTPPYRDRGKSQGRRPGYSRDRSRSSRPRDRSPSVRRYDSRYRSSRHTDDYRSRINAHSRSRSPIRQMAHEMGPSHLLATPHMAVPFQPFAIQQPPVDSGAWPPPQPPYGRYSPPRRTPPHHGSTHYRDHR
ncbi:hypothetical protein H4R20_001145 [Coemansia guatemalensis]|uniref:SGF29 C-terminal domain-containing protein n=1 Tax=Coemansia guatemalensis TaxID=2761395 RepID=A0A9W8HZX2_9FUNG|nr:hypothetical protein H4R20_001145 [Coemansia guatemalensis]